VNNDYAISAKFSGAQTFFLVCLRVVVGWHFLYEGWVKIVSQSWSATGYLQASSGPLGGLFQAIAGVSWMMWLVDVIMAYGLLLIGLSLILGLYTRIGCIAGAVFMAMFYVSNPPLIGTQAIPGEGNYLIVNKNLVELAAVMVLLVFPSGNVWGLDQLISSKEA
jgi:thiosulfate dehydrogenase [quinone] large subunit